MHTGRNLYGGLIRNNPIKEKHAKEQQAIMSMYVLINSIELQEEIAPFTWRDAWNVRQMNTVQLNL